MNRLPLLTGLALRDLWVSFRLLLLLSALVAAAVPTLLVPRTLTAALAGAPPGPLDWYAWATAAGLALAAGAAAWSMAGMRRRGAAAWLAARDVPRPSLLLGWFVAAGMVVLVGTAAGAVLAWFALNGERGIAVTPAGYASAAAAVVAAGLVAVSAGLLVGCAMGQRLGTLLVTAATAGVALATASGRLGSLPQPLGGLELLARIEESARPVAAGLVSAGLALSLAAVLLILAAAALDARDL